MFLENRSKKRRLAIIRLLKDNLLKMWLRKRLFRLELGCLAGIALIN